MKNYQLILLTTVLFVVLFYDESVGVNLGILGVFYSVLTLFRTPTRNKSKTFFFLFGTSVLSSVAFAWYADFASFLAIFSSLALLSFTSHTSTLKSIFVLPVFAINFFSFIYRVFQFDDWIPKKKKVNRIQKIISTFLIPFLFLGAFFWIYSMASSHFAKIVVDVHWDLDFWQFFVLAAIGFFIAFNYWNIKIYDFFLGWNHYLKNDFLNEDKTPKATYSFMDVDSERSSGVVSFFALNILLLVFIITFNYEQFYETSKTGIQLSDETHERVNAVILSIIMAILVIMFYFKGNFNFDKKSKNLKIAAKVWIFLNAILVFSAILKNSEYVLELGFTYKRLGVFTFLLLSLIGLYFTFYKIKMQKTNAFLLNTMFWYFYGTILVCSFFNWGGLLTQYNLQMNTPDFGYVLDHVNFNDRQLLQFVEQHPNAIINEQIKSSVAQRKQGYHHCADSFLSKVGYYCANQYNSKAK